MSSLGDCCRAVGIVTADGQHRYDVILDIGGNRRLSHLRRVELNEAFAKAYGADVTGVCSTAKVDNRPATVTQGELPDGAAPSVLGCLMLWLVFRDCIASSKIGIASMSGNYGSRAAGCSQTSWATGGADTDYHAWKALLRRAGVRDARLHDARHTAATVLLVLGVPERTVMEIMGWSTTGMAAQYQHVTDPIRQEVASASGTSCGPVLPATIAMILPSLMILCCP